MIKFMHMQNLLHTSNKSQPTTRKQQRARYSEAHKCENTYAEVTVTHFAEPPVVLLTAKSYPKRRHVSRHDVCGQKLHAFTSCKNCSLNIDVFAWLALLSVTSGTNSTFVNSFLQGEEVSAHMCRRGMKCIHN